MIRRRGPVIAALAAWALLAMSASAGADTGSTAPSYDNLPAPAAEANGAGEPSIGANWLSGNALFQSNLDTYRVSFDDRTSPATATWTKKNDPTQVQSLDPILFTDSPTGRTLVSQLLLACSRASITTDDGETYTPSEGCGAGTVFDHQTVGGGPYAAGAVPPAAARLNGRAFYYCAQDAVGANCARSDDGGRTFGPGSPIYNFPTNAGAPAPLDCAGLHGHLRVAPDGTAYVPNFDCNGKVAVSVSEDNGTTWQVRPVPTSTTQDESDPSIASDASNTVYMGWEQGADTAVGSKAFVGVSKDHGKTWTNIQDVGASLGIQNIQFPEVIAGDAGRAAFAFVGTTTAGDDQKGGSTRGTAVSDVFPGVWHMYIANTTDGGSTWTTQDVTPTAPVQRGCIWLGGGSSSCRNLLDFNDITVDKQGRVLLGWADGCTGVCETTALPATQAYDNTANKADYRAKHGTITRQATGVLLFDATPAADVPESPASILLPLSAVSVFGLLVLHRRRRKLAL